MPQAELEEIERPRDLHCPSSSSIPIVLIHDGGGTIFQYYMLGPLNRPVYGIGNPYYATLSRPEGGIAQLAREYAEAIRKGIDWEKEGKEGVIIGGWSFGGMLSLEVSRLLSSLSTPSPHIHILGILMIDSICPWSPAYQGRGRVRPTFRATTSDSTKEKVITAFDNARAMLREWAKPKEEWEIPSAVMIRATEAMPIENSPDGMQPVRERDMGWGEGFGGKLVFKKVIDAPGNHFSMFNDERLNGLTELIKQGCGALEQA